MEKEKIELMELFVLDDEVARCEAALPSLRDAARLAMLVLLSWHLRQRETMRAIALCAEAEALLAQISLPKNERQCIGARLLLIRGEAKWLFAKLDDAEAAAREALETFTTLSNAIGCADAHWLLAFVANDRGDQSLSVAALKNAAQACSTCGDGLRTAAVQVALSYLTVFLDRPTEGQHLASRVDILVPPDSHQGLVALANSFQIRLYFRSGDFANAIICGKLAHGAALASGQIKFAIIATRHIGAAFFKLHDVEGAHVWMQSALKLARTTGWPMTIGGCLAGIADLTYLPGQPALAQEMFRRAHAALTPLPETRLHSALLQHLGNLALACSEYTSGFDLFRPLDEQTKVTNLADTVPVCRSRQASKLSHLDRQRDALAIAASALELARAQNDTSSRIDALHMLAEIHSHHSLPVPKDVQSASLPILYLQLALDIAIAVDGFTSPPDFLDTGACECARGDAHARTYALAAQARTARDTIYREAAGRNIRFDGRNLHQSTAPETKREEKHGDELTRFLASASHDLRQPLHALNLYLSALSNVNLPEPALALLTNVRKCAAVVDGMFLSLLDLSRLDAQVVRPHFERFPVASLLTRIALEFSPQATSKGLDLRIAPCSAWVQCDPTLVAQILRNFAANAVRYTASGKILIGCRRKGELLRIAVYDTGIGISPHQQETLFDALNQVDNKRRDTAKGLGLGLAIVQRLGRLLSTPIMLVSTLGQGSMFAIDLPISLVHPVVATPNEFLPAISIDILNTKLIVVVDDDEAIREATRILLEQWGCVVVAAVSGADALLKLGMSPHPPDALICDYRLSLNESGLDVIRGLHNEFNHEIPALLVTGDTTPESIQEVFPNSLPVLHKPVRANILRDALIQLLSA